MYYDSVQELPSTISLKLAKITIVGMRHHKGSFDSICEASYRPARDQRLFLVRDIGNKFDDNAVMLHDGQKKLGYVVAAEAPKIRKIIDTLKEQSGGKDQVLVVKHAKINDPAGFNWVGSTQVEVVGHVHERIARKVAQEGV